MQKRDSDKPIHEEEDFATLFAAYLSEKQNHLRPQHGDLVQGIVVAISDKELSWMSAPNKMASSRPVTWSNWTPRRAPS